ncbi:glycosyltransferase [Solidesulfovibrio carbinolicus]|uniref:Glycosyl transferase family 1 domain-containing protein n=1 Tax=Solidesulfovibrio carbinolicus TaxID=296842 RepID=A0A4V0YRF0_9BACT|nr:glycosyltransferase [Solidesulfovibrio carbinolicus]QAZ69572.1 hypothetical protein C3Y92_19975 [Solidesulfovibrio carbinolicus]
MTKHIVLKICVMFSAGKYIRSISYRVLRRTYTVILPIARVMLTESLKFRLSKLAMAVERQFEQKLFAAKPSPLNSFPPAFPSATFEDGPVVLCNNALAWGGVERQVVYTLRGLVDQLPQPPHLLCMRLGHGPDFDFYMSSLEDFPGEVRNVVDLEEARRHLASVDPGLEHRIIQAVAWLPPDVQEEILRFAGDFVRLKPAVTHIWQDALSISAGYAARMVGVPRILISSRNMAAKHFAYHRPHMADAYRELAECSNIVMLNNSLAGATDYADWLGLPGERFHIIRNGIDTVQIRRPDEDAVKRLKDSLGLPDKVPVVGSIFRFYAEKCPLLWIETAARVASAHPDCHFVIFGTGPMRDDLIDLARSLGFADRLHLPGTIINAALGLLIMDVFMLTSQFEGTPNVVLEAGLMGVPVIATNAGGTAETIDAGRTGFISDFAEPDVLASLVSKTLNDDAWRLAVRKSGPEFILERFGLERMLSETLFFYGQLSK